MWELIIFYNAGFSAKSYVSNYLGKETLVSKIIKILVSASSPFNGSDDEDEVIKETSLAAAALGALGLFSRVVLVFK